MIYPVCAEIAVKPRSINQSSFRTLYSFFLLASLLTYLHTYLTVHAVVTVLGFCSCK